MINELPDEIEIFYADESGFEEYYSRTYGYSIRGDRVYGEVPGTHFGRTSVIGAINRLLPKLPKRTNKTFASSCFFGANS